MGSRQFSLLPELKRQYEHGGQLLKGKRKSRRPFNRKKPLHLVFRSDEAKGRFSFLMPQNRKKVINLLKRYSCVCQIRIYDSAINSNHLHLLVGALDKRSLIRFLRSFPGALAMSITGSKKASPLTKRFWTVRVYSRIVEWGRGFGIVKDYILQNTLESLGLIPYQPRKNRAPE